jgi:drug/metabolite transporter (DMT)-like permease
VPPIVFGIVGVAAVIHATWNVIIKTSGDPLRTSGRAMAAGVAVALPFAVVAYLAIGSPGIPPQALGLAVVSGLIEVAYFVLLSAAYRRGDLSVVYPIARGTAPLFAVAAGVLILGERLSPLGALGVAALVAGILVIQRPWRALRTRSGGSVDRAVLFALATGLSIASYSAVDSVGVKLVAPWIFAAILFPVGAIGLVAWIRFVDRADVGAGADWARSAFAGVLSLVGYLLILFAYTIAPLTIVAPLRESAVVLVSGWGSFRLGEAVDRRDATHRMAGALLVLVGAILVALGG